MPSLAKNFLTAGGLALACAAVIAGTGMRDRADLHMQSLSPFAMGNHALLASLSNGAPDVSATDFYEQVTELLKDYYVDPVNDERKLATGAVRGMVGSLGDPNSRFMNPAEFAAFESSQEGKFEGIGVQLEYVFPSKTMLNSDTPAGPKETPIAPTPSSPGGTGELVPAKPENSTASAPTGIPALQVAAVVPGSPAQKAGVLPGDSVESVDGYWVMNPYDLTRFNRIEALQKAGKITDAVYLANRKELRQKLAASISLSKARDRICMGESGIAKIDWNRHGQIVQTSIHRGITNESGVVRLSSGALAIHFLPGEADHLKEAIGSGPVTLDLRNNDDGDLSEMKQSLALFAPAGVYGQFATDKEKSAKSFVLETGHNPRKLKLIVDGSTGGVAEVFALALKAKGYATLVGTAMAPSRTLTETVKLPDGSGYTLATGIYEAPGKKEASAEGADSSQIALRFPQRGSQWRAK